MQKEHWKGFEILQIVHILSSDFKSKMLVQLHSFTWKKNVSLKEVVYWLGGIGTHPEHSCT